MGRMGLMGLIGSKSKTPIKSAKLDLMGVLFFLEPSGRICGI